MVLQLVPVRSSLCDNPRFFAPDLLHIPERTASESFLHLPLNFPTYLLDFDGYNALAPATDELPIPSAWSLIHISEVSFALIARSLLLILTSLVYVSLQPYILCLQALFFNFFATASVSLYSGTLVATPDVPDATFAFFTDEPGPIGSVLPSPFAWCPASIATIF